MGNRVFLTAATSDKPMKAPSLGVDYSNEYLAELRKQGLSPEEINRKLYERDREMPDELVISLMLYCYDLERGTQLWERQMYKGQPAGGRHAKNSFASETRRRMASACMCISPATGYAIQSPFAWKDLLFVTSGAGSRRVHGVTVGLQRARLRVE